MKTPPMAEESKPAAATGKTVLIASPIVGEILPRVMAGALRAARALRWEVHYVVCTRAPGGGLAINRSPGGGSLEEIFELLKPDGMIVAGEAVEMREVKAAARAAGIARRIPVVHFPEPMSREARVFAHGDPESFARLALRELLASGFDDFAYVPFWSGHAWSRIRGEAFARLVGLVGKRFHAFGDDGGLPGAGSRPLVDRLVPFLASVPKPCGVFAANDTAGEAVLNAARSLGLDVPSRIAVVAVDDISTTCDFTRPTLSSVRRDLEGEGRAAVELLAEWMARPSHPPEPRAVPAVSVVRRASTQFSALRDWRVSRAQEYIRIHACDGNCRPRDAAREMGLSRSAADRLFRSVAGRTVLREIHAVRIERAKEKLRAGTPPAVAAAECGYASLLDFRRVFRRETGVPVVSWMKGASLQ